MICAQVRPVTLNAARPAPPAATVLDVRPCVGIPLDEGVELGAPPLLDEHADTNAAITARFNEIATARPIRRFLDFLGPAPACS
jgi:hypothetical protein